MFRHKCCCLCSQNSTISAHNGGESADLGEIMKSAEVPPTHPLTPKKQQPGKGPWGGGGEKNPLRTEHVHWAQNAKDGDMAQYVACYAHHKRCQGITAVITSIASGQMHLCVCMALEARMPYASVWPSLSKEPFKNLEGRIKVALARMYFAASLFNMLA